LQKEYIDMVREERFYAFIIAHTSRSRSRIQRIRIERKTVTTAIVLAALVTAGSVYGIYGLTQQAAHLKTAFENQRLREENDRQRQELEKLNNRVEKVEDTSRKLAEKSGVVTDSSGGGAGGPALPLDEHGLDALQQKMNRLERVLRGYEAVLRSRGYTPLSGQSKERLKVVLAEEEIRLVAPGMSSIQARTSRLPGELQLSREQAEKFHSSAGRTAMASWSSSITAEA
jgi:hypothetical protein